MDELIRFEGFAKFLTPADVLLVIAGVGLLFVIAYFTGRKEENTRDFFLGSRGVPAIVACLSFVATEVSAVTIIGVPAIGFSENWQYLQFFIGSAVARLFVALLFIPVFYKFDCTTIYEFLRHRFGVQTQRAGSAFFFVTRLLASGVRLYAACAGVGLILGLGLLQTLILFSLVSIVFIGFGGIKAVVWTGAYETLVFYLAGAAVVTYLLVHINGGLAEVVNIAAPAGRMSVFNFKFDLRDATTFWAGGINAFFVGLAIFGTDQELVQRLLTVKTRRASQKAIIGTILAALPITFTYLLIGTLLYVFYQQSPSAAQAPQTKEVFQFFVAHHLPAGLKGLVLAAIVLASIDSPLSSLSTSFVTDIYRPLWTGMSERHYLWVGRAGVVAFGLILAAIAYCCQSITSVLWFAFQIISVTGGSTLGIFLLGLLTRRRGRFATNLSAMLAGVAVTGFVLLAGKFHDQMLLASGNWPAAAWNALINFAAALAWSWLIVLGTVVTFGLGYLLDVVANRFDRVPDGSAPGRVH